MFMSFLPTLAHRKALGYMWKEKKETYYLLVGNLNLTARNIITDVLGTSTINLASHTESRAQNLFDSSLQLLCH